MGRPDFRLGIDLGGTKIHAVVIDPKGKVVGTARTATKVDKGYAAVLGRIADTAREAVATAGAKWKDIGAVGLGVPGPVDVKKGIILMAPNLGWDPVPVGDDLHKLIDREVVLGNDVNFGALGEATYGCASEVTSAYMAFVGTGLGGAYVHRGRIINGAHGYAGEIGHLTAPFGDALCGCGRTGCLETTASRSGIVRQIREAAARGQAALVPSEGPVKSSALRDACAAGCPVVSAAVERCAQSLAWGLGVIAHVVDPRVFVLGGGVAESLGQSFVSRVAHHLAGSSVLYTRNAPDLRLAVLGDDAVAMGAAVAGGDAT
jgi:glucokinase